MKKLTLLLLLLSFTIRSQNAISTTAHINTQINKKVYTVSGVISYLFYDDSREQLVLKINLIRSMDSKDTTGNWLLDLDSTTFYFVGNLQRQEFVPLPNNSSKKIHMQGKNYLNGISQNTTSELILSQSSQQNLTSTTTNGNIYDTYKVDFSIEFLPKDHKVDNGKHKLKDPISISVASGRINQLKPEFNNLVKDLNRD